MKPNEQSDTKDLAGKAAIDKMKELAEDAKNCFFTTKVAEFPQNSRPMALQEVDEEGNLWFISSTDSHKNEDIEKDPRTTLYFQNNGSYEFLVVHGETRVHQDKATIDKYWTKFAEAWFDSKDDPTVSILQVVPNDSYYWDTKDGKIVSFIKMSFAAMTGNIKDDGGIEGELKV